MTQVMLSPWGQHSPCHSGIPAPTAVPAPPGCCLTEAGSSMGSGISTKEATRYPRQARHRSRSKAVTRHGWMTPATKLPRHVKSVGIGKPLHGCTTAPQVISKPYPTASQLPYGHAAGPESLPTPRPTPFPLSLDFALQVLVQRGVEDGLTLRERPWPRRGAQGGLRRCGAEG